MYQPTQANLLIQALQVVDVLVLQDASFVLHVLRVRRQPLLSHPCIPSLRCRLPGHPRSLGHLHRSWVHRHRGLVVMAAAVRRPRLRRRRLRDRWQRRIRLSSRILFQETIHTSSDSLFRGTVLCLLISDRSRTISLASSRRGSWRRAC